MKLLMIAFAVLLFVVLTPGILFTMPIKTTPLNITIIHGLLFGALLYVVERSSRVNLFEKFESRPFCEDPDATFRAGSGKCFNEETNKISEPICPAGTKFNYPTSMCSSSRPAKKRRPIQPTCPDGYVFDAETCKCEYTERPRD